MKRIKKQFVCLIVCAIVMSTMSGCLRVKRTEDLSDYLHTKVPLHYDHVLFPDKDQIPTNGVKLYRSESISSLMTSFRSHDTLFSEYAYCVCIPRFVASNFGAKSRAKADGIIAMQNNTVAKTIDKNRVVFFIIHISFQVSIS